MAKSFANDRNYTGATRGASRPGSRTVRVTGSSSSPARIATRITKKATPLVKKKGNGGR